MKIISAGVPFLSNLISRRVSDVWQFAVEVAVRLNESDLAEFDRMEVEWKRGGHTFKGGIGLVCKLIVYYLRDHN